MKKLFIILILTECLFSSNIFAQGCNPWCTTSNSISTTDVLGGDNSNANPLYIQTNGTTRVTVSGNSYNTGIGTTSPNNLLQLHSIASSPATVAYTQFTNTTTGSGSSNGLLVGIDDAGNGIINCRGGTPINFLTSGAKRLKIQGGGSILIGDYSGAIAYNQVTQYVAGSANSYHGFVNDNTGVSNSSGNDGFKIGITYGGTYMNAELISQQSGANMNFYTSGGSVTNRLQIASGGNVGIGDVAQSTSKFYLKNDYSVSSAANGIEITSTNTGGTTNGLKITATGSGSYP